MHILNPDLWSIVLVENRVNIDNCLAESESQLPARRLKLVLLNNKLLDVFARNNIAVFTDSIIDSEIIHCCLFELCHEFICICRNIDYKMNTIHGISDIVNKSMTEDLQVLLEPASQKKLEALYYISGWALHATKRVAVRRKAETALAMNFLLGMSTIDASEAKNIGMPTGKIDRVMAFGGLIYSSKSFSKSFIGRDLICICFYCGSSHHVILYFLG